MALHRLPVLLRRRVDDAGRRAAAAARTSLQLLLQRPGNTRSPMRVSCGVQEVSAEGEAARWAHKLSLPSGQTPCFASPDVPISRRYGCIPSNTRSNPYIPERRTTDKVSSANLHGGAAMLDALPRFAADSASGDESDRKSKALNAGPSIATPAATPSEPSRFFFHDLNLLSFSVPMADETLKREDTAPALRRPRDVASTSASLMKRGVVAAAARAAASI